MWDEVAKGAGRLDTLLHGLEPGELVADAGHEGVLVLELSPKTRDLALRLLRLPPGLRRFLIGRALGGAGLVAIPDGPGGVVREPLAAGDADAKVIEHRLPFRDLGRELGDPLLEVRNEPIIGHGYPLAYGSKRVPARSAEETPGEYPETVPVSERQSENCSAAPANGLPSRV